VLVSAVTDIPGVSLYCNGLSPCLRPRVPGAVTGVCLCTSHPHGGDPEGWLADARTVADGLAGSLRQSGFGADGEEDPASANCYYASMSWAQIAAGLIGVLIGSGTMLLNQRWSIRAAQKREDLSHDHDLTKAAQQNLVIKLRVVYEWVSVAEGALRALRNGISRWPALNQLGYEPDLAGVERIVGNSHASDIMRGLAPSFPEAAEDFARTVKIIEMCYKETSELMRTFTLVCPNPHYYAEETGRIDQLLSWMREGRRHLKGQLTEIAESIGEDFLATRSEQWSNFAKKNAIPLAGLADY
jgi:hypothetical protein